MGSVLLWGQALTVSLASHNVEYLRVLATGLCPRKHQSTALETRSLRGGVHGAELQEAICSRRRPAASEKSPSRAHTSPKKVTGRAASCPLPLVPRRQAGGEASQPHLPSRGHKGRDAEWQPELPWLASGRIQPAASSKSGLFSGSAAARCWEGGCDLSLLHICPPHAPPRGKTDCKPAGPHQLLAGHLRSQGFLPRAPPPSLSGLTVGVAMSQVWKGDSAIRGVTVNASEGAYGPPTCAEWCCFKVAWLQFADFNLLLSFQEPMKQRWGPGRGQLSPVRLQRASICGQG